MIKKMICIGVGKLSLACKTRVKYVSIHQITYFSPGTPYDNPVEVTHNHPQPGMKHRVLSQVWDGTVQAESQKIHSLIRTCVLLAVLKWEKAW